MKTSNSFDNLKGKTAVITGGAGVIGSALVKGIADVGINVAILDIDGEKADKVAKEISSETKGIIKGYQANVLDKESLIAVKEKIIKDFGEISFLINGAGGNSAKATTKQEQILPENKNKLRDSFFGLDMDGFDFVFDLNFKGTVLTTMVFAEDMIKRGDGNIINISSMNAFKPLTKIPAYSAAKASVNNFTQWLAVHFAKSGVRVNAIAPGFFLTQQNYFLLIDEKTGEPTERGKKIIANTPFGRYGKVEELTGTVLYLLSELSGFVTGVTIPIDGGYSAYGGV